MIAVNSYSGMLDNLADAFRNRYKRKDVNITGILFARPTSEFAKKEILPEINYWHHRSDYYTDFYCPGYMIADDPEHFDGDPVAKVGDDLWFFESRMFVHFLEQLEELTSWSYKGGAELLVTNARYNEDTRKASLDLRSAIVIDLEHAREDQAFRDVTRLCETIFEFAKNLNESTDDPCWEYSDREGIRIVKRSLKEFLLAYLPKWLKPEAKKAFHFVTRDITAKAA